MSLTDPLRDALERAGYSYDGVEALIGADGHAGLLRNETTPARRRTGDGSALSTLVRLFLLQVPVTRAEADRALPDLVDRMGVEGLLSTSVGEVAARVDIRPYADDDRDLWVASDLTPGLDAVPHRVGPDHVLGISSASTSLAQLTVREPVARALDLGTGCGVQALHLSRHALETVATDVNARALWLTRLNLGLNRVAGVEVREGSFYAPVAGERFDLVATNPPFVISPATGERLVYRDSGLPGDQAVEHVVRGGVDRLAPGGLLQVLANWAHVEGRDWSERLTEWVGDHDALLVQREVLDVAQYVELWLRDAGLDRSPDYVRRYDTWLSWFAEQGVAAVGFGWINVWRREPGERASVEALDWPHAVEQPVAPAIAAWQRGAAYDRTHDDEALAATRLRAVPGLRQETYGEPGAADPETIVLRQQTGLGRARRVDTATAALVGASDGDLTVGAIGDALLTLGVDHDRAALLAEARSLVREGFLEPDDRNTPSPPSATLSADPRI